MSQSYSAFNHILSDLSLIVNQVCWYTRTSALTDGFMCVCFRGNQMRHPRRGMHACMYRRTSSAPRWLPFLTPPPPPPPPLPKKTLTTQFESLSAFSAGIDRLAEFLEKIQVCVCESN